MAQLHLQNRLLTSALVVAGAWVVTVPAEAAVYKGRWDPAYDARLSSPMPELGWSGEASFAITDKCLSKITVSGWVSNGFGSNCFNQLSITSAAVTLYDLDTDKGGSASPVTLSYASGLLPPGNLPLTLRMYVDVSDDLMTKNVRAVDGGFLIPEKVTAEKSPFAVVSGSDYYGALYWLGFSGFGDSPSSIDTGPFGARAILASCSYKYYDGTCSKNDSVGSPAVMTIVPEPEAYLLGLVSLAVLGVWSRRRMPTAARLTSHA